jgi:hypothetical protein
MRLMGIGSSGDRIIGSSVCAIPSGAKEPYSREEHRAWYGENQEIQIMISISNLKSSSTPLCSFVSSVVNIFSVSTIFGDVGIHGNSLRIGVGQ